MASRPLEYTKIINLGGLNKPLYLKAKSWGFISHREEIILSKSQDSNVNKEEDYIFSTMEIYYVKKMDNEIIIYAPQRSVSEPLIKTPFVTIRALKGYDELEDYRINFIKYGLKRIRAY